MARIADILERHPLFAGLPGEALGPLVLECRLRTPKKGDRIFSLEEPADAFYIVAAGRVKLSRATPRGGEHVIEVMRPGESFALMPVLEEGGRYPVDASALVDASLVRIPREPYLRLLQRRPELHVLASNEIGERMRRFSARLEEVTTRSVQARIAAHLLRLAAKDAGGTGAGTVVDLGATREVAAATIGTAREVLIRTLRSMEKAGVVAIRARRVEIRDPRRLRAMADG